VDVHKPEREVSLSLLSGWTLGVNTHPRQRLSLLIEHEMAGTWFLGFAALAAISWASILPASYERVGNVALHVPSIPSSSIDSIRSLIANGFMVIFFLTIGLEIGRERRDGALQRMRQALAPLLGALGGMAGAALFYEIICLGFGNAQSRHGWGIPMATDVAFTLGALSVVRRHSAPGLRTFLLTLAICDDIATVIVLAFVSHHGSSSQSLFYGFVALLLAIGLSAVALRRGSSIALCSATLVLWWAFARLGIEAPLAGVVTGAAMAMYRSSHQAAERFEQRVIPLSTWIVLPLFTLTALGVNLGSPAWRATPVILVAVGMARLIGKPLGVVGGVRLAQGLSRHEDAWKLPAMQVTGAAVLCAIGFTVPLIFAANIFGATSKAYAACQVSLVAASLVAAGIGTALIARQRASQ